MAQIPDSSEIQPGGSEDFLTGPLGYHFSTPHPSSQDDDLQLTASCEVVTETAEPADANIAQLSFVHFDPKAAKRNKRSNSSAEIPGCLVFDSHPTPKNGSRHRVNHLLSPLKMGDDIARFPVTETIDPRTPGSEGRLVGVFPNSSNQSWHPEAAAWPLLRQGQTAADRSDRNDAFHLNSSNSIEVSQCDGGDAMKHPDPVSLGDGSTWQVASNRAGDTRDIPPSLSDTRELGYIAQPTNGQFISDSQVYSHTMHFIDDSHNIDAHYAQHTSSSRGLNYRFDAGECSVHRTLTHHRMRRESCGCTLIYRASGFVGPVGVLIYNREHGYEDASTQDGITANTSQFEPYLLELGTSVPFRNGHSCFGL